MSKSKGPTTTASSEQLLVALGRKAAVGDMAGAIVHELASVMQTIYGGFDGMDEILTDEQRDDPETREAVDGARDACNHVVQLYRNLRAFLHGDPLGLRPVSLDEVLQRVRRICSGAARGRSTVLYEPERASMYVKANRVMAIQLFVAMVRASIGERSGGVDVKIRTRSGGERAVIEVVGEKEKLPEGEIPDLADLLNADGEVSGNYDLACARVVAGRMEGLVEIVRDGADAPFLRATLPVADENDMF